MMPADALPEPRANVTPIEGARCLRRTYRDALGRPMSGTVRIVGQTRSEDDNLVVPVAPVKVVLLNGRLDVHLPPDTYTLQASLQTVDGDRVTDNVHVEHS